MLKTLILFALLRLASCQIDFYSVASHCDHDLCEPNGVCQAANGNYSCKCNPGFRGKHCEIEDCVNGHCKMAVNYCNAYPKVKCLNDGQCVNTARGFRCRCPSKFGGKYCENEKKTFLDGEVIIVLSGKREEIIRNLDRVLTEIGQVNNITVHVQIDAKSRQPMAYSISERKRANGVAMRAKREVTQNDEVLLLARIETTSCLERKLANPQLKCLNSIASAVEQLRTNAPLVDQTLAPLGIKILRVFSKNFQQERQIVIEKQLIIVFVLIITTVLLLLLIAFLMTRKGQMKQNLINACKQMSVNEIKSSQRTSLSSIATIDSSTSTNNLSPLFQISPSYGRECAV